MPWSHFVWLELLPPCLSFPGTLFLPPGVSFFGQGLLSAWARSNDTSFCYRTFCVKDLDQGSSAQCHLHHGTRLGLVNQSRKFILWPRNGERWAHALTAHPRQLGLRRSLLYLQDVMGSELILLSLHSYFSVALSPFAPGPICTGGPIAILAFALSTLVFELSSLYFLGSGILFSSWK